MNQEMRKSLKVDPGIKHSFEDVKPKHDTKLLLTGTQKIQTHT